VDVLLNPRKIIKENVTVVASRLDISLATNPAATTVVGPDLLDEMPRPLAIDEPLKAVAGVKVDNQANGERVHLSIHSRPRDLEQARDPRDSAAVRWHPAQ